MIFLLFAEYDILEDLVAQKILLQGRGNDLPTILGIRRNDPESTSVDILLQRLHLASSRILFTSQSCAWRRFADLGLSQDIGE